MGRAARLKIRRRVEEKSAIYIKRIDEETHWLKYQDVEMVIKGAGTVDDFLSILRLYLRERALGNPLVEESEISVGIRRNCPWEQLN